MFYNWSDINSILFLFLYLFLMFYSFLNRFYVIWNGFPNYCTKMLTLIWSVLNSFPFVSYCRNRLWYCICNSKKICTHIYLLFINYINGTCHLKQSDYFYKTHHLYFSLNNPERITGTMISFYSLVSFWQGVVIVSRR